MNYTKYIKYLNVDRVILCKKNKKHLTDTWFGQEEGFKQHSCVPVNCQVCRIVTPSYHKTDLNMQQR